MRKVIFFAKSLNFEKKLIFAKNVFIKEGLDDV